MLMTRRAIWWGATAALAVGVLTPASARPVYLQVFKAHYNTAQGKATLNAANCAMCHVGMPAEKRWNVYGEAFRQALGTPNVQDRAKIVAAYTAIESRRNPANNETFGALLAGDRLPGSVNAAGGGGAAATAGPWEAVFSGMNMDGLTKMHAGNWVAEPGVLRYTGGGNGWIRSNRMYNNYSAVIVWRFLEPAANNNDAGIFLKAKEGDNNNPWPNSPQLNMGPGENFGSIGGAEGTRARPDLINRNDWNTYQITVWNGMATVAINGQPAWTMASSPALRGPGYIGIQAENRPFEVAQFWVQPLQ
jgi:hypothetical protein